MKKILILIIALFLVSSVNAIDIYDCQDLDIEGETYVLQNDVSTDDTCFIVLADYVTLDANGSRITGSNNEEGIYLNNYDFFTIRNAKISGFDYGIRIINSNNNFIEYNQIVDNSGRGMRISNSDDNIISGNRIENNEDDGIYLQGGGLDNLIYNNNIKNNGDAGIYFDEIYTSHIYHNYIKNNGFGISFKDEAEGNLIYDNFIMNNTWWGIYLADEVFDNSFYDNTVESNGVGFYLEYDVVGNSIYNNYIEHNILFGIYVGEYAEDNLIYNNFFNNNQNIDLDTEEPNFWNIDLTHGRNIINGPILGGNYWATPSGNGFSQTCEDLNTNGICDRRYIFDEDNIDFYPLTFLETVPFMLQIINPLDDSTVNSSSVWLNVVTSENTVCEYILIHTIQYQWGGGGGCSMPQNMSTTGGTYHSQLVEGLETTVNNATQRENYGFDVDCVDNSGNSIEDSVSFFVEII